MKIKTIDTLNVNVSSLIILDASSDGKHSPKITYRLLTRARSTLSTIVVKGTYVWLK